MSHKTTDKKLSDELNFELLSIYNACKEQSLSSEDLNLITAPLKDYLKGPNLKILRLSIILFLLIAFLYWAINLEVISWHLTAVSRIALIQILPIWDWKYLHKSQCLLPKILTQQKNDVDILNCDICEHLTQVKRIEKDIKETPNLLHERYLNIHEPVIVTENDFVAVNITEFLINNADFLDTIPCDFASNLFVTRDIWMDKIIERVTNPIYGNWFIHFRNCELNAVKYLRLLRPRADFLPYSLPRTHTNWVLMSQDYNGKIYKALNFEQNVLILFEQIDGINYIELNPRDPCFGVCDTLKFELRQGDYLIYISKFWELKYKGNEVGFNAAVVEEIYWD